MSTTVAIPHKNYIQRLYRQALRSAYDHYSFKWDIYRQHCLHIRARFEANKHESNPVRIEALVRQTEEELEQNKHPRPFKCILE
jgi:NADH dehydrogenase (ubiquinone) 1 beta subcomplex subunit 9